MTECPEVQNSLIQSHNSLSVEIFLDPGLRWFRGHFPAQPLLPGIVQMQWVLLYSQKLTSKTLRITSVPQLKFLHPVLPGQTLQLQLTCSENGDSYFVRFKYAVVTKQKPIESSHGSLVLC